MKEYAFIAVTANGALLARRLQESFGGDVFVKDKYFSAGSLEHSFCRLSSLIKDIFYEYDALIFFSSTGIAVRMIAPYIVHKSKDPAVVVIDEQGMFAISLLSGHLGGANELTAQIASLLNAQPVITTATDRQGKIAPDVLARRLKLVPYPFERIKSINSALVEGHDIPYYVDVAWNDADSYVKALHELGFKASLSSPENLTVPAVFLSPRRQLLKDVLVLSPRRLIAGIGCRRGVSKELISRAVQQAKQLAGCTQEKISIAVSTVVKSREQGLLDWAEECRAEIHFYENPVMQAAIDKFNLPISPFVQQQIGIGNVCEAAILAYNEKAHIILPKTKFEKVTVSLGWE